MVTVVQFMSHNAPGGPPILLTFPNPVQVGNKIVVGCVTPSGALVTTDNLGNVYTQQAHVGGVWGMLFGFIQVATITTGGSCTVSLTNGPFTFRPVYVVAEISGLGDEMQGTIGIGSYAATIPGLNPRAIATGVVPTSDTYIITIRSADGDAGVNYQSDTGDTLLGACADNFCAMFGRQISAPGLAYTAIQSSNTLGVGSQISILSVAFSRPLPTPGGLTKQFASHPGWGMIAGLNVPAPTDGSNNEGAENTFSTMRSVHTFFPYTVSLGSLVLVACIQNFTHDHAPFNLTDTYGNVYTLVGEYLSVSNSVAVYKTKVTALPPVGMPFRVDVAITETSPQGGTYAHPAMVMAEYKGRGDAALQFAGYMTIVDEGGGTWRIKSNPLSVDNGEILFSVAAAGSPSDLVSWGTVLSYTSQLQWTISQYDATVNRPRVLCFIAMDKTAPSAGVYDSEVLVNNDTAEAMALVSIGGGSLSIACPTDNVATQGVFFSTSLAAVTSGGTPPYTWSIVGEDSSPVVTGDFTLDVSLLDGPDVLV